MKSSTPPRAKQAAFKTIPLRWSLGPRGKPPGASVELVEYLESRRRPRSTSQSIVPLLMGAASGEEKSAAPRSTSALSAQGGERERALATGPAKPYSSPGDLDGLNTARKLKENARQEIRLPKKFDLPLSVTPSEGNEKPARPEGQKATNCQAGGHLGSNSSASSPNAAGLSRNSKDSCRTALAKVRANAEERDLETDRLHQGTFTLLRSVFWKKENKRKNDRAEVSPQVSPVSLVSARLSPASPLDRDVRSAPSSLRLPRKASRPSRGSALGASQRTAPGDQTSYSTLQRVKYHTLSLGRKKTLPESSF